jgi:TrmH family RNA methyltransferase
MPDPLRSTDNPLVKDLVRLHDGRHRAAAGTFLVEGRRAIDGCLAAGWQPLHLLVREGEEIPASWPECRLMSDKVAAKLTQASTPSGYCAAFPLPMPPMLDAAAGGLVLCGLSDPGNVGTLLRCAGAFAIRQVVLVGGCDPWGYKVVQATAGTLPLLSIHRWPGDAGPAPLQQGAPCCALVVRDGQPPEAFAKRPRWVVVGGEADGLRPEWIAACQERLTLPMPGDAESLNAAVAGAIAAYLLLR